MSLVNLDFSWRLSRGALNRGGCKEKEDLAARCMGEYVSKGKTFFDEVADRLRAPRRIAHE